MHPLPQFAVFLRAHLPLSTTRSLVTENTPETVLARVPASVLSN